MGEERACKPDEPVMKAWESYKAGADYQVTRKWAGWHVDGAMWAAFSAGFTAGQAPQDVKPEPKWAGFRPAMRPDGWPTRNAVEWWSDGEKAIAEAMRVIEHISGGSVALTDAVTLLAKARARVADHVEGPKSENPGPGRDECDGLSETASVAAPKDRYVDITGQMRYIDCDHPTHNHAPGCCVKPETVGDAKEFGEKLLNCPVCHRNDGHDPDCIVANPQGSRIRVVDPTDPFAPPAPRIVQIAMSSVLIIALDDRGRIWWLPVREASLPLAKWKSSPLPEGFEP